MKMSDEIIFNNELSLNLFFTYYEQLLVHLRIQFIHMIIYFIVSFLFI